MAAPELVPSPVLLGLALVAVPVVVPIGVPDDVADELELAVARARKSAKVLLPVVGALIEETIPRRQ